MFPLSEVFPAFKNLLRLLIKKSHIFKLSLSLMKSSEEKYLYRSNNGMNMKQKEIL